MSSYSSKELPVFDTVEEERDYWKNRCLNAERQDQQLMKCHDCVEKEDWLAMPRKRARIEDAVPTDPINLPEPCFQAIMKYLNGKEILKCMEVNKTWKKCIESCKVLMDRSMREVCVTPTIRDYSLSQIDELFNNDTKRNYRHMRAPFILHSQIIVTKIINPFERYASTLETLTVTENEINDSYDTDDEEYEKIRNHTVKPCVFPKLKKLVFEKDITLRFLDNLSLPELTLLKFGIDQDIDLYNAINNQDHCYDVLKKYLLKCPKLKTLHLKYNIEPEEFEEDDPIDIPLELDPNQPKIQSINMNYYAARFLREQKYSLVNLTLHKLTMNEMSWILRDLKMLKNLKVCYLYDDSDELFVENDSIEKFTFYGMKFVPDIGMARPIQVNLLLVQRLLLSLPSLVNLSMRDDRTGEMIRFLASNMINLKMFSCKYLREPSQLAYQHIKNNSNEFINSTFKYVIRRSLFTYICQREDCSMSLETRMRS